MRPDTFSNLTNWASKPSTQNFIAGVGVAFSAGVFTSLNLLGAGGSDLEQSHVIQTANAILSSVWFFSACLGGTYLKFLGPGLTMGLGISTFAIYVGSLWYYGISGQKEFTLIAGAVIGLGAGAVFITSGYISVAYSHKNNKGKFVAIQQTLQAVGSIICSIIPVILNKDNSVRATVPAAIYITYIIIVLSAALLAFIALRRPHLVKDIAGNTSSQDYNDVDVRANHSSQDNNSVWAALKENVRVFKEVKLLLLLPAFLPAGSFLIYLGSVNVFNNTLRARSLLSFIALVVQIPFGHLLQLILDNSNWSRRRRALIGLIFVGIPLSAAWIWEIVLARNYDRHSPPTPTDWNEPKYGPTMVLFVMNWTASVLWQYLVPWYIGSLPLTPDRISHYMGVQRGFLAAGEAICFGIDAAGLHYVTFASIIFIFYAIGIAVLACFAVLYIWDEETEPAGINLD